MSWNYRVVKRTTMLKNEQYDSYGVHTAWYGEGEEEPHSISEEPLYPIGGSLDELIADMNHMREALNRPILSYEDF